MQKNASSDKYKPFDYKMKNLTYVSRFSEDMDFPCNLK